MVAGSDSVGSERAPCRMRRREQQPAASGPQDLHGHGDCNFRIDPALNHDQRDGELIAGGMANLDIPFAAERSCFN